MEAENYSSVRESTGESFWDLTEEPVDYSGTGAMQAFPEGKYSQPSCRKQMNDDLQNQVPEGEIGEGGIRNLVTKYCRACEFACPVGA